tara:strand:+ start:385 stop:609 length:225 start_codon:yes stop_codon:yes gene_type:complete
VKEGRECSLEHVGALIKHYIIELISSMTNSNIKVRDMSQDIFSDICTLMRESFGAVNNLFTMILVGLAGNSAST